MIICVKMYPVNHAGLMIHVQPHGIAVFLENQEFLWHSAFPTIAVNLFIRIVHWMQGQSRCIQKTAWTKSFQ